MSKDNKRLNTISNKAKANLVSEKERYENDMAKKEDEIFSLKANHDQQIATMKSAENKLIVSILPHS